MTVYERELWWDTAADVLEIVIAIGLILLFGWMAAESFNLAEVCQ